MTPMSRKRLRWRAPSLSILSLPDSHVDMICHFLTVTDHCRLGLACRQLCRACSEPSSWEYVVFDKRVTTAPPFEFWEHLGPHLRVLDGSRTTTMHHIPLQYLLWENMMYGNFQETKLTALQVLRLPGFKISYFLSGFSHMEDLHTLDLSYSPTVVDLDMVKGLTRLRSLNLAQSMILDFKTLRRFTELRTLRLEHTCIRDVLDLANLTKLRTLNIQHTTVSDLTPLAGLTLLQHLCLRYSDVTDVTPLAGLVGLKTLDLTGLRHLTDITPLAHLKSLETLKISNTNVTNFQPLTGLAYLATLHINNMDSPILNDSALKCLPALKVLQCRYTHIDRATLNFLKHVDIQPSY